MPRDGNQSHSCSRSPQRRPEKEGHSRRHYEVESKQRHHTSRSPSRSRSNEPSRGRSASPDRKRRRRSHSRSPSRSKSRDRERKRRNRSRSHSRDRKERRKRDRSVSSSSDSDGSRSRRKRDKKREKKRSSSKERRREKKREKKDKKGKKKQSDHSSHWGKYGIISDVDIFSKTSEFHTWLVEERKVNPETISKDQQRKEFARYVEDYNTATLPHEKYYNMEAYERRMSALRQGEYLPPTDDLYDFEADMKAIKGAHKKKPVEQESYLSREQIMELRKVQQERVEVGKMKLLGMDIKSSFGVRMDGSTFDE